MVQADSVVHHFHSVLAWVRGFTALPVSAAVERDDPVVAREVLNRRYPHLRVRGPTVNQNDWFALPEDDIPDADTVGIKELVWSWNGLYPRQAERRPWCSETRTR